MEITRKLYLFAFSIIKEYEEQKKKEFEERFKNTPEQIIKTIKEGSSFYLFLAHPSEDINVVDRIPDYIISKRENGSYRVNEYRKEYRSYKEAYKRVVKEAGKKFNQQFYNIIK